MNIWGGEAQQMVVGLEWWRPSDQTDHKVSSGAYLSRNKEKGIYTDVPKIHGKHLADISVSEESMVPGYARVTRGESRQSTGKGVERNEEQETHKRLGRKAVRAWEV